MQDEGRERLVDRIALALAGRNSRRGVLAAAAAALAGGAAIAAPEPAAARCRNAGTPCKLWIECCSLRCNDGHCSNKRNAGAQERRKSRKRRRRKDRRQDQRHRRKQQRRSARQSIRSMRRQD
jgi:hypothetical protein